MYIDKILCVRNLEHYGNNKQINFYIILYYIIVSLKICFFALHLAIPETIGKGDTVSSIIIQTLLKMNSKLLSLSYPPEFVKQK